MDPSKRTMSEMALPPVTAAPEARGAAAAPATSSAEAAPGREATAERTLVDRARAGDEEAFEMLVDLHRDRVFALALRVTRSRDDAQDVAQEAFVRAWLALPRFRGDSSFGTWLHRIVARRAVDRAVTLQARRAREAGVEHLDALPAAGGGPRDAVLAMRLERLMGDLSPAQRAAVTLFYWEDRPVEEIAGILEMPENTVKTHLSRARAALREAWMREEGGR
jgi:RNA polymerase sigma-70 factor (ECF subfamily)